jgi:FMN reductase
VTVPTAVFAAAEDWGGSGGPERELAGRITRAGGELADLLAGRPAKVTSPGAVDDPFAGTPSFEELLRGA